MRSYFPASSIFARATAATSERATSFRPQRRMSVTGRSPLTDIPNSSSVVKTSWPSESVEIGEGYSQVTSASDFGPSTRAAGQPIHWRKTALDASTQNTSPPSTAAIRCFSKSGQSTPVLTTTQTLPRCGVGDVIRCDESPSSSPTGRNAKRSAPIKRTPRNHRPHSRSTCNSSKPVKKGRSSLALTM